ncbi:MAG TPA: RdgB/HAM1 family non-canonical purine NTP pyrophosphatase [Candidatus Kapabacteria bacterium]|nr:RdgB/HAM1 family non-canonical purine NTP pyrophosphatase [Candidatus Kapabacteria bacterium]HOM04395.1 RdgB/HAM1 family non-canonical purine NTP pyrophosphatase [Candidatus Kapabacteria bacterium]HPP39370.1 RdgB/HAM1 family non-canonical purine NTP pyrophosphatase [Candidatus Kapabacteria bacterium]HPU23434.1 RdgB/HAM1 family non-canonical purine NTP pyrophosphatase [Candidatus Kapabacteria bacterium]
MKLLVATNNKHKLSEIEQILELLNCKNIELTCAADFGRKIVPEETGTTYFENAEIKAREFFREFKISTIADDSGLEIDFLDGKPGVRSSCFAGEEGNHAKNRKKVIELLQGANLQEAKARFRCVICYIDNNETFFVEGTVEGKIIPEERGENGFGYDSMFVPDGYDKTFAEMTDCEKNKISHRANAIKKLVEELKSKNIL